MRVVVFGAGNALGRRFCELAPSHGIETIRAARTDVNYTDIGSLHEYLKAQNPDLILNATALKQPTSSTIELILINSLFPHLLASVAGSLGLKVIHVSTAAVFSGHNKFKNTIESHADPTTYYGRSRVLGEVLASNVCIVRTDFIAGDSGIVTWLCEQRPKATVDGWVNFKWSGSTVEAVCHGLFDLMHKPFQYGIRHLSTKDSISKYDVVLSVVKKLGLDLRVKPVYYPYLNRSLVPTDVVESLEEALYASDCAFDVQSYAKAKVKK